MSRRSALFRYLKRVRVSVSVRVSVRVSVSVRVRVRVRVGRWWPGGDEAGRVQRRVVEVSSGPARCCGASFSFSVVLLICFQFCVW